MKKIVLLVIPFFIISCTDCYFSDIQQRVIEQTKMLIDSGYIMRKYALLCEIAINDSSQIYSISESDAPIGGRIYELPSKIYKYKNKFLCFIELDEPEMTMEETRKITMYTGGTMDGCEEIKWILGLSKYKDKQTLIDFSPDKDSYYDFTELWPYFSGYVKDVPLQIGISGHNAKVSLTSSLNVDSVRNYLMNPYYANIENIYGEIYLKNNTDSLMYLSSDSKAHCAIVNNHDTLYLSLLDSLPLQLKPNESKKIKYESIPNNLFFEQLPYDNAWTYLYNLFCNSAYSLMKINQKPYKVRVMHLDCGYGFHVTNKTGKDIFEVLNQGIYDKEARTRRNIIMAR